MKIKIYTKNHSIDLLKKIENNDEIFSAKGHAYIIEKQFANKFESRENLLRGYLLIDHNKLEALSFLIDYIKLNNIKNIISFGAGECVLEHILSVVCPPPEFKIFATDFDDYFIRKAKEYFPNIEPYQFDFFNDNLTDFCKNKMTNIDLGVSFDSFYVMDDYQYFNFLKNCNEVGMKKIIYFSSSTLALSGMIKHFFANNNIIRKLFMKEPIIDGYKGKLHGYARSKRELKKLFKAGGYRIVNEASLPRSYKNVYILERV